MQYDGRVNCILMATGLEFPEKGRRFAILTEQSKRNCTIKLFNRLDKE